MKRILTSANIAHARLVARHPHRLHQPMLYRIEGVVLAAAIAATYMLVAWIESGAGP